MLEAVSRRNNSNSHFNAHRMFTGKRRYGFVAYCWILWEGKDCWRRVLPAMAESKFLKIFLRYFKLLITKIICRFCVTIREFPTTGPTLLHGLLSLVNLLQQFFYQARQFVFEVNARKRNNSIYNISCQFIHKNNHLMVILIPKHKSTQDLTIMDLSMDPTIIEKT